MIMSCAYMISKSENVLIIKDWSHILNDHREVLGGSNKKRSPQFEERFICILQNGGEFGLYMFYAILPKREEQE
jgi:hypothetical protein